MCKLSLVLIVISVNQNIQITRKFNFLENKQMDTKGGKWQGEGGGGGMNWEIGIDMYALMCIKLMTNKNLPYK